MQRGFAYFATTNMCFVNNIMADGVEQKFMRFTMRMCHLVRSLAGEIMNHIFWGAYVCTRSTDLASLVGRLVLERGVTLDFALLEYYLRVSDPKRVTFAGEPEEDSRDWDQVCDSAWTVHSTGTRGEMSCCTDFFPMKYAGCVLGCMEPILLRRCESLMSPRCWSVRVTVKRVPESDGHSIERILMTPATKDLNVTQAFLPSCIDSPTWDQPSTPYVNTYFPHGTPTRGMGFSVEMNSNMPKLKAITFANCYEKADEFRDLLQQVPVPCLRKRPAPDGETSEAIQPPRKKRDCNN